MPGGKAVWIVSDDRQPGMIPIHFATVVDNGPKATKDLKAFASTVGQLLEHD